MTTAETATHRAALHDLSNVLEPGQLLVGPDAEPYWRELKPLSREPLAVARPVCTDEVSQVVRICAGHGVPLVARGHGSSLTGGVVPCSGAVVLSLERFDRLTIHHARSLAHAGAGVVTARLQAEAAALGLMYPPDPTSIEFSTVGGNVATNAGGASALKYGTTADYVQALTVVVGDGSILELGGRGRRGGGGYRLAQLFAGSEGTLGVITEVTLRLLPLAAHRATALIGFGDLGELELALRGLLTQAPLPAAAELLDRGALEVMSDRLPPGFPRDLAAALLVDMDGFDPDAVQLQVETATARLGGVDNRISQSAEERRRLWELVTGVGRAIRQSGAIAMQEDLWVPVDRVAEMLRRLEHAAYSEGSRLVTTGHAGDGCLHPWLLIDAGDSAKQPQRWRELITTEARALGGSGAGEYGVGLLKRDLLGAESSPELLRIMQQLKRELDPAGLFNGDKLLPALAVLEE